MKKAKEVFTEKDFRAIEEIEYCDLDKVSNKRIYDVIAMLSIELGSRYMWSTQTDNPDYYEELNDVCVHIRDYYDQLVKCFGRGVENGKNTDRKDS